MFQFQFSINFKSKRKKLSPEKNDYLTLNLTPYFDMHWKLELKY